MHHCRHLRRSHVVKQVFFNFNVAIIVAEVANMNGRARCRQIEEPIKVVLVGVRGVEHAAPRSYRLRFKRQICTQ